MENTLVNKVKSALEGTGDEKLTRDYNEYYTHYGENRLTFEDYSLTRCINCEARKDCPHADNMRRLPKYYGGLGMCFNLKEFHGI